MVKQIHFHQCKGRILPLCQINARLVDVAERNALEIKHWVEDGLGRHRGFIVKTPSGAVAKLSESLEHPEFHIGVELDELEIVEFGSEKIVVSLIDSLGLHISQVSWRRAS